MHIRMRNAESLTNSQINDFLKASAGIEFSGQTRAEVYIWVEKMLVDQEYQQQRKKQRGAIRAYLSKVAGLSLAQITRLIRAHARTGKVEAKVYRRQRFATKYTPADIVLLAQVDRAPERLSGPATQCILKREYAEYPRISKLGPEATEQDAANPLPSVFTSVQELGLKLEARDGMVKYVVIEKAEKVPVEN